jgi:hypothetical protein
LIERGSQVLLPKPMLPQPKIDLRDDDDVVEASMIAYVRAAGSKGATRIGWERAETRSVAFRMASRRVWDGLSSRGAIVATGTKHANSRAYRLAEVDRRLPED